MNFMQAKYKDDHTNAYDNSVAKKTARNKILKAANFLKKYMEDNNDKNNSKLLIKNSARQKTMEKHNHKLKEKNPPKFISLSKYILNL